MRQTALYLTICTLAALIPLLPMQSKKAPGAIPRMAFKGWPETLDGQVLRPLPLTERELQFGGDFPGQIGRFTDGRREVIIRWVTEATRKLHPASDCFEGIGFRVRPLPLHVDGDGSLWSSFLATRGNERLRVRERIYTDSSESWTDVSSWYWAAARESSAGPWWAVTIAESEPETTP
jgi:DMSO/TMAO reductase YedYZ molybdopterin-dependent catalytic subunit